MERLVIIPQVPCRSSRVSHPLERWYWLTMEELQEFFLYRDNDQIVGPITYEEPMLDIDSLKWQIVMESDMESMCFNQIWTLVHVSLLQRDLPYPLKIKLDRFIPKIKSLNYRQQM